MACLNPGLDDLQERTVATGTRAVADYELPLGLHPGATPANPGVLKGLILRGFLEAALKWRRGRDTPPIRYYPPIFLGKSSKSGGLEGYITDYKVDYIS